MEPEQQLLDIERKLWTNDAIFYKNNLIEETLLVFPEAGIITSNVAVDAILAENAEGQGGQRSSSATFAACGLQTMPPC